MIIELIYVQDKQDEDEEEHMRQESEEGSIIIEEVDKPLEELEIGSTSIDVTDNQDSIGEVSVTESQEEKVQEQNREIEQAQEESKISKSKQKRRITSYLSNISKQVEKQGNQINKMLLMIHSLQKQKQTKSIAGSGPPQLLSVKQIKSQIGQLQKQMTQTQKDIQRIRTSSASGTRLKTRSSGQAANVKPRSRKNKSLKRIMVKRRRKRST